MYKNLEDLPLILTVNDLRDILNIGQRQAYELAHSEGFPAMKVRGAIRIYKPGLVKWIDEQIAGQITYKLH